MNHASVSHLYVTMLSNYFDRLSGKQEYYRFNTIEFPELPITDYKMLPLSSVESLISKIERLTKTLSFGLDIGECIHPSDYGIVGYAMMNCASLRQSAEIAAKYFHLLNQTIELQLLDKGDTFYYQLTNLSSSDASKMLVELQFSSAVHMSHFLVGPQNKNHSVLLEVRFQHEALADKQKYQKIFNCPVKFGQSKNELIVSKEVLQLPVRAANPKMLSMLLGKVERIRLGLSSNTPLGHKVCSFVGQQIVCSGLPSAVLTAKHFNMSLSTLKKHLNQENLNYTSICDDVRKSIAIKRVAEGREQLQTVSDYLGFSNPSAFHRAFKRWTGLAPAEYRRYESESS